ncbi:MAG: UDP-N-acetylmuramyl-tripeptide synthetase [Firmicutes bacterium]|nr:UDP-N-acetylmuramyl-tripeptide synthetase [Bacillota bacterium]
MDSLLNSIPIITRFGEYDQLFPVKGLAYHSGKVAPGYLFIAIKGYKTDGHRYLPEAARRGALAAVVEELQPQLPLPQFQVADSRRALAALADTFYDHPSQKLTVIGLTASNGKTTTAFMTNAVLEEQGLKTGLLGTVIMKIGNRIRPAQLTTPESLDLQAHFHRMVEESVGWAIMEVSSAGLELHRVDRVEYDIVAINNISREHIDFHGSFDSYFQTKAALVRERRPDQWALFNLDCPYSASLVHESPARKMTYGLKAVGGDFQIRNLDLSTGRARFTAELTRPLTLSPRKTLAPQSIPLELAVPGLHSVYNSMIALMVGLLCGVPVNTIRRALKKFKGVERRFELIFEHDFKVIDDHFANSGNIDVTLETLKYMDYRRLHLVYALRGGRGTTVSRESAETLSKWAPALGLTRVITTSSRSHVEEKDRVTAAERRAFFHVLEQAQIKIDHHEELPPAIAQGLTQTRPGDILLLAGCQGMDPGAKIALEAIHHRHPELKRELVFSALQNRVAGI